MKICIIGAGIVGINTALMIAQNAPVDQRVHIQIYDSEPQFANVTSARNGCQVSVCNSLTWNSMGNVVKGVKWMFDPTAPLKIGSIFDIDKLQWLYQFLKEIPNQAENSYETVVLAQFSRDLYVDWFTENPDFVPESLQYGGILKIQSEHDAQEQVLMTVRNETFRTFDDFNNESFSSLLAELHIGQHFSNIVKATYYPNDFTFSIPEYCEQVSKYLLRGVNNVTTEFIFNHNVENNHGFDDVDHVIVCTGVNIRDLNANLPLVYPVKGYSITYNLGVRDIPKVSILDEDKKIVCSFFKEDGISYMRVAGTAELDGYNYGYSATHPRIKILHEWAVAKRFVDIDTPFVPYSCLRPMTPSMLPFVESPDSKWIFHGGHGHLGQTLSMATAYDVAKIVFR